MLKLCKNSTHEKRRFAEEHRCRERGSSMEWRRKSYFWMRPNAFIFHRKFGALYTRGLVHRQRRDAGFWRVDKSRFRGCVIHRRKIWTMLQISRHNRSHQRGKTIEIIKTNLLELLLKKTLFYKVKGNCQFFLNLVPCALRWDEHSFVGCKWCLVVKK